MDISISEVSIVMQGPITDITNDNLIIIRQNFPDIQIILSTWKSDNYKCIQSSYYNELVLNDDPGFIPYPIGNCNRQIVSTFNGLEKVSSKYVLKLRTDSVLYNSSFLLLYKNKISRYNVFKNPILILSLYAKDPTKWQVLFHISDIFFFGLTSDIKNLYNIPLASYQFLTPEQYIFSNYLKNIKRTNISEMYEISFKKILMSELYISNSFILIDYTDQYFLSISTEKQVETYISIFKKPFYDLYNSNTINKLYSSNYYLITRAMKIYILHFYNYKAIKILQKLKYTCRSLIKKVFNFF